MPSLLSRLAVRRLGPPTVAVVPLVGAIGGAGLHRRGLSLAALAEPLERAFKMRNLKAVALAINSPGGSAAQSSLIHRRIRALAAERGVPVVAFAEDVAASGGYWLALAADEIFADENSIVGSIGVVYAGFGLERLIEKIGVERRLYTAGAKKSLLDPFLPEREEDVRRLEAVQAEIHGNFRDLVRARRGGRLKGAEDELYSGEFWTGRRALALGLVDGLGDLRAVMRQRYGETVRFRVVRAERGLLRTLLRSRLAEDALAAVEERLAWTRFGL